MFRGQHPGNKHLWLIPLAAAITMLPLILHGGSCGHDLLFHVQSWIDAAAQLRHGHYPRWATTPAWNAGEPRFVFYPPLSWLLGALLTLLFPIAACPAIFIFLALTASGLTFHHLARQFTDANAALITAALYLANPYMLFCAFERSALAELLAAAWMPLLLLAALRARPTIRSLALPIALLWLTNAPAAVIGCYALALIAALRLAASLLWPNSYYPERSPASHSSPNLRHPERSPASHSSPNLRHPERSGAEPKDPPHLTDPARAPNPFSPQSPPAHQLQTSPTLHLALTYLFGTILGLALPAFYLIPAAYQRRFVQISMAVIPGLFPEDNFLFAHTADAAHDAVNHTASVLALVLLILSATALTLLWIQTRHNSADHAPIPSQPHIDPDTPHLHLVHPHTSAAPSAPLPTCIIAVLTLLTATIAILLTPISAPIWRHLPELVFLQFPWRLLILLTPILVLAISLVLNHYAQRLLSPQDFAQPPSAPSITRSRRGTGRVTHTLAVVLPFALTLLCFHLYGQPCDPADTPTTLAHLLATHHGTLPTDEYTPAGADNDLLRADNPAFWVIPSSGLTATDPNAPAPHTIPTATQLNPSIDTDDTPIPLSQTISTPAPRHLTLHLTHPSILVLNLRDYPSWRVTNLRSAALPTHLPRLDGLIAIALPSGRATIDIAWRNTPDQILGLTLSILAALAMIAFVLPAARRRRTRVESL